MCITSTNQIRVPVLYRLMIFLKGPRQAQPKPVPNQQQIPYATAYTMNPRGQLASAVVHNQEPLTAHMLAQAMPQVLFFFFVFIETGFDSSDN